jgi:hypothetical protein
MYYSPVRYFISSVWNNVQLACVTQNSSVHSEPGSSSLYFIKIYEDKFSMCNFLHSLLKEFNLRSYLKLLFQEF